jgi:glucose dehydrogenase
MAEGWYSLRSGRKAHYFPGGQTWPLCGLALLTPTSVQADEQQCCHCLRHQDSAQKAQVRSTTDPARTRRYDQAKIETALSPRQRDAYVKGAGYEAHRYVKLMGLLKDWSGNLDFCDCMECADEPCDVCQVVHACKELEANP